MKIYFAGSIRGGREDQGLYFEIIKLLQKYGEVLTEHIGFKKLSDMGETNLSEKQIYDRDMKWVSESDLIIAEVTTPSIGVGYEIGYAESMNKKIICLYQNIEGKKGISAMVSGNKNLFVKEYRDLSELAKFFEDELSV